MSSRKSAAYLRKLHPLFQKFTISKEGFDTLPFVLHISTGTIVEHMLPFRRFERMYMEKGGGKHTNDIWFGSCTR